MVTLRGETRPSGERSGRLQMLRQPLTLPVATSVNGGSSIVLDQPSTGGGNVVLSIPVQLNLRSGSNAITFSAGQSSTCFPSRLPAHTRRAADCVCTGNEGTDVPRFPPARLCCGPG